MIDFANAKYMKMTLCNNSAFESFVAPILVKNEQILRSYRAMRDGVVFTNRRIVAINVQGVTGKKRDMTSLPYSKIQAYSVETAGVLDLDSELELWFSGLGKVKFEFTANTNVNEICQLIASVTL